MSYCTYGNISMYFLNKSFTATDYITPSVLNDFISADEAIINATLKSRYKLPITESNDLLLLKTINEKMVVGTIDDITREKTADGTFERGRNTRKEALDLLKQIKDGTIVLDGTQKDSVIKFNNVNSDGNEVSPRFKDSNIDSE